MLLSNILAQELHLEFKDEIIVEITPCTSIELCDCPEGTEHQLMHGIPICSIVSREAKRLLPESPSDETLTVSFDILLGLSDHLKNDYNMSVLDGIEYSFQEFLSLDVVEASGECVQGFHALSLNEKELLQFSACAQQWPSEIPLTISIAEFIFNAEALRCAAGYEHFLVEKEYMTCIPCFPGTFCPVPSGRISSPFDCPLGTYTPLYAQHECLPCPFGYPTNSLRSASFDACRGAEMTFSLEQNVTLYPRLEYHSKVDAENDFKKKLFDLLTNTDIFDTVGVIHILKWET